MKPSCVGWRPTLSGIALVAALSVSAQAQLISLKTVPVAAGDQFLLFPSHNLGMGGVSIALDDAVLDPFVNPAKGGRLGQAHVFAAPVYYDVSNNAGSAGALSAGALFGGRIFGGGMVALQQIKRGDVFFGPVPLWDVAILPPNALSQRSATNKYGFLTIGTRLPGDLNVAASGFFADLNAIDGVEHLYAMASSIDQSGDLQDLRLGLTKTFAGERTLEAVALYRRFDMQHDVTYVDWVVVDSLNWIWEQRMRVEANVDKTDTWGLHVGYVQPIGRHGWRVGGTLTGN